MSSFSVPFDKKATHRICTAFRKMCREELGLSVMRARVCVEIFKEGIRFRELMTREVARLECDAQREKVHRTNRSWADS